MGETSDHIFVYSISTSGYRIFYQLKGNIWLQQGDTPSWNKKFGEKQVYWPCSRPETIYYEGLIMAAIYFSDNEKIELLAEKVYGNKPEGMGVRLEDPNYSKLIETIKKNVSNLRFTIVPFGKVVPLNLMEEVNSLGFEIRIAPSLTLDEYSLYNKEILKK